MLVLLIELNVDVHAAGTLALEGQAPSTEAKETGDRSGRPLFSYF